MPPRSSAGACHRSRNLSSNHPPIQAPKTADEAKAAEEKKLEHILSSYRF